MDRFCGVSFPLFACIPLFLHSNLTKLYPRKFISGTIALLKRSIRLPAITIYLMKNVITCSVMLAGYIAAAVLFLCGALLYLPIGMVVACVEVARDRKARASALQVKPLQPELGKE